MNRFTLKVRHRLVFALVAVPLTIGCAGVHALPSGSMAVAEPRPPAQAAETSVTTDPSPNPEILPVAHAEVGDLPVKPVGHHSRNRVGLNAKLSARGCQTGACACCPPITPHGYAAPPMMIPNAFGIDPQEFLCDGGDAPPAARVTIRDTIDGLAPEDTVVAYETIGGDVDVVPSNRVCVYAPRFASVRKITGAVADGRVVGLNTVDRPVGTVDVVFDEGGVTINETIEPARAEVTRRVDAIRKRNRGVPVEGVLQPLQNVDVLEILASIRNLGPNLLLDEQKALVEALNLAAITWSIDESVEVAIGNVIAPEVVRDQQLDAFTLYEIPDAGRLRICKLADRHDAAPGDIVTFALQVQNVGDAAVRNVVITDNLVTRLEYVEGSQTASGGAEFENVANSAGSLRLQWTLTDELKVGETITIRFRTRVR